MKIKELKLGEPLTLKKISEPTENLVWVRGEYVRSTKTYSILNFADTNREKFLPATKEVYTDFTF